jgi:oligopeptide/dipeptide ABC transporter ATP-binding protein
MSDAFTAAPAEVPARLAMSGISKSFGGVSALQDVDFVLRAGEIHGLMGENGAGKSTLMKIIAGLHTQYQGRMALDGREVHFRSARDALAAGIGMVHQELSIVPDLSVAENVYLGKQPTKGGIVDWRAMVEGAREHLASLGIEVDPKARMGSLSIGLQQLIELARVLFSGARIVILDEPTSGLDVSVQATVLTLFRSLRATFDLTYMLISHDLAVVRTMCSRVAVMYLGRIVESGPTEAIFERPRHPYTRSLLAAIPRIGGARVTRDFWLQGEPPDPGNIPSGCRFRTRCPKAADLCAREEPALSPLGQGAVACHFPD